MQARFQEFLAGRGTLDVLLEAQRFWADALANEYRSIADYNSSLAGFELAKGTILQHDNVVIAEGQLPKCAQVRATEHERERSNALVLRERAVPHPAIDWEKGSLGLPDLPANDAPSLPSLMKELPPRPKDPPPAPTGKADAASQLPARMPVGPVTTKSDMPGMLPTVPSTKTSATPASNAEWKVP